MDEMKEKKNKCDLCGFVSLEKKAFFIHLETHEGAAVSCRLCQGSFENKLSFYFHKEADMCKKYIIKSEQQIPCVKCPGNGKKCIQCRRVKSKVLKRCLQCNETFQFRRHYEKHLEGHKRNNCNHCCALFTTRRDLAFHLAEDHQIKIHEASHPCLYCERSFAKRKNLYYHYNQHAAGWFVCLTCGKFLETKELLIDHEKKHSESKKWSCEKCSESFFRRQQYLQHILAHEKYKCKECGKSFAAERKLSEHKQTIHGIRCSERKHQCSECGQWFARPKKLMLHFRVHTGEKPYECEVCAKRFCTPGSYTSHMVTHFKHRVTVQILKCDDCGREFHKKHDLERHIINVHKQKWTFECEHCDQKFKYKENLKRHIALHTEKPQFVCEHCGAPFHSLTALKDHFSYVHSHTREFNCKQCGMSFKRKSGLNRHMASHSESRPFVCECGQSYKRSSHLRRHKERVHGEKLKNKKLVRLSHDMNGVLVPIEEENPKAREKRQKKVKQQKNGLGNVKQDTYLLSLLPPTPPMPSCRGSSPPAVPPPAHPPSPLTLPSSPVLPLPKASFDVANAILPLADASEVEKLQALCSADSIIAGNIELPGTDEFRTIMQSENNSGNVLHTIVSYNLSDFTTPGALSSITGTDSQLVFSGFPASVSLDQGQTVVTVTLDPLMDSAAALKQDGTLLQERDGGGIGPLPLDENVTSQLALDSMADPLYMSNVSSALIASGNTNSLMVSAGAGLDDTLMPSTGSSTLENGSALLNSVDSTLVADLQHSEVLLNLPAHLDSQQLPYSLASSLNISVADCESLLAVHGSNDQTSPIILGSTESVGLESSNLITISDYLNGNFSF